MSDVGTFLKQYRDESMNSWILAAMTDEYMVDRLTPEKTDSIMEKLLGSEKKVLEIRIFDSNKEHRLFRSDIGKDTFAMRSIYDIGDGKDTRDQFDEDQYLDIDEARGHTDGYVYTTGGGRYHLPLDRIHDAKIRIRYYLEQYPETGQARIADWRVVEFVGDKDGTDMKCNQTPALHNL